MQQQSTSRSLNRFSNDFTSFDATFPAIETNNINISSSNNTKTTIANKYHQNAAVAIAAATDLHSPDKLVDDVVVGEHNMQPTNSTSSSSSSAHKTTTIIIKAASKETNENRPERRTTPSSSPSLSKEVDSIIILPESTVAAGAFRVSKPHLIQSNIVQWSRDKHWPERDNILTTNDDDVSNNMGKCYYSTERKTSSIQAGNAIAAAAAAVVRTTTNKSDDDRFVELTASSSCSSISSFSSYTSENCEVSEKTMRLNIPPSAVGDNNESSIITSAGGHQLFAVNTDATRPSLTIHVNQSDHNRQQQQDVVNQSSGISIVNCYRTVPVNIVNNNNNNIVNVNNSRNSVVIDQCGQNVDRMVGGEDHSGNHEMTANVRYANKKSKKKCDNQINDLEIVQVIALDNAAQDQHHHRTFTSSEAQTDVLSIEDQVPTTTIVNSHRNQRSNGDGVVVVDYVGDAVGTGGGGGGAYVSRAQRRRERRERREARSARQQQQIHHVHHPIATTINNNPPVILRSGFEILPDILNNHVPPPYTALAIEATTSSSSIANPPQHIPSVILPHHQHHHHHHQTPTVLIPSSQQPIIAPFPMGEPTTAAADEHGRYSFPLPIIRR